VRRRLRDGGGAIGFQQFAYGMSFLTIAVYWLSNRDLFARLHHVDRVLTVLPRHFPRRA